MRASTVLAALAATLLLVVPACSRQIEGTAKSDPTRAPVQLTQDGYGITIGFPDAPVALELYTEPQCSHCADLQSDFGDELSYYVAVGQLKLTYRPMTFLDTGANQHSARVANALFVAASTAEGSAEVTTGQAFQRFAEEAWATHADGPDHPTADELADLAREAGIPGDQASRIALGKPAVDLAKLQDTNFEFLYLLDPLETGTPSVYDLTTDEKLDVYDDNWLSKVMES